MLLMENGLLLVKLFHLIVQPVRPALPALRQLAQLAQCAQKDWLLQFQQVLALTKTWQD